MITQLSRRGLQRLARPALFALIATLALPSAAHLTGADLAFAADKGGNDGGRGGGGSGGNEGGRGGDEPLAAAIFGAGGNCLTHACNPTHPKPPKITKVKRESDHCGGPARRVQICTTQDDAYGQTTTCRVVLRTSCEPTD